MWHLKMIYFIWLLFYQDTPSEIQNLFVRGVLAPGGNLLYMYLVCSFCSVCSLFSYLFIQSYSSEYKVTGNRKNTVLNFKTIIIMSTIDVGEYLTWNSSYLHLITINLYLHDIQQCHLSFSVWPSKSNHKVGMIEWTLSSQALDTLWPWHHSMSRF